MSKMVVPGTLASWQIGQIAPDTTVHPNVEIRELAVDPSGPHVVHVTIFGHLGASIVGTVHDDEHEFVIVQRGLVTLDLEGRKITGGPGTVFNIPPGAMHGYIPMLRCCAYDGTVELLATYRTIRLSSAHEL